MKKNVHDYERVFRVVGGAVLASMAFWGVYYALGLSSRARTEQQANEYMPVQSDSEEAAGHPIVGVV